jgi:hypothetical protein
MSRKIRIRGETARKTLMGFVSGDGSQRPGVVVRAV